MSENQKIKTAIQRTQQALTLKPALGKETSISTIRITNGLTCEIQEGNWKICADMPASIGGNALGPTPGVYGRAALGSCLAIGYMMKAAELEIPITGLEVVVEADYDNGALFGTADNSIPPGYLEIRYTINIDSDATEDEIMQLLDSGDAHSPYLDIFTRAQTCVRNVNINSTKPRN